GGHEGERREPGVEVMGEGADRNVVRLAGGPILAADVVGGRVVVGPVGAAVGQDAVAGHALQVTAGLSPRRAHLAEEVVDGESVGGGVQVVVDALDRKSTR